MRHSLCHCLFALAGLAVAGCASAPDAMQQTAAKTAPEAALARSLAANCAACHGTAGKSQGAMPALAGQDRTYFIQQMRDFKSGKRNGTVMPQIAKGFNDEQIALMAGYFSSQK